jgi:hypothetical protein
MISFKIKKPGKIYQRKGTLKNSNKPCGGNSCLSSQPSRRLRQGGSGFQASPGPNPKKVPETPSQQKNLQCGGIHLSS